MGKSKGDTIERISIREILAANYNLARKGISSSLVAAKTVFRRQRSLLATEAIFFGGRTSVDVQDNDLDECRTLASELHPIDEIVKDKNKSSLEARFLNIVALERIWENLGTSDLLNELETNTKPAVDALQSIDALDPRAQLVVKKFYLVKALCSLDNSPSAYDYRLDNFNQIWYPEVVLRKEYIAQQIKLLFAEAAGTLCNSDEEFLNFSQDIFDEVLGANIATGKKATAPDIAPERYKDRENRKEKPDAFIRRVYTEWLGNGLLRPDIKALDKPLYEALYKHGVPDDFEELLPKSAGRKVKDFSLSDLTIVARRRKESREAYRRKK